MSEQPSLKDFEEYLKSVVLATSDQTEARDALQLMEHLRQFRQDFKSVRKFLS